MSSNLKTTSCLKDWCILYLISRLVALLKMDCDKILFTLRQCQADFPHIYAEKFPVFFSVCVFFPLLLQIFLTQTAHFILNGLMPL